MQGYPLGIEYALRSLYINGALTIPCIARMIGRRNHETVLMMRQALEDKYVGEVVEGLLALTPRGMHKVEQIYPWIEDHIGGD